jgi:membrane associated rhomboid family serine protease
VFSDLPALTKALLWSNVLVFLAQGMLGDGPFLPFMLWPWGGPFQGLVGGEPVALGFLPWQVLTYGFLHGDLMHLVFNMLALVMFGGPVERVLGTRRFAIYYFTCVVGAGLVQLVVATLALKASGHPYPTLGASGGVFGVLLAFGMMFPQQRVMLLFPPIPMKAWVLVVGYGVLELVMGITRTQSGVAHFAHLGGMAFGLALLLAWRRPRRR